MDDFYVRFHHFSLTCTGADSGSDPNCDGLQLGDIVAPGINNLADFGFNDVARGMKVSFR